jgi:hypothetical protein
MVEWKWDLLYRFNFIFFIFIIIFIYFSTKRIFPKKINNNKHHLLFFYSNNTFWSFFFRFQWTDRRFHFYFSGSSQLLKVDRKFSPIGSQKKMDYDNFKHFILHFALFFVFHFTKKKAIRVGSFHKFYYNLYLFNFNSIL